MPDQRLVHFSETIMSKTVSMIQKFTWLRREIFKPVNIKHCGPNNADVNPRYYESAENTWSKLSQAENQRGLRLQIYNLVLDLSSGSVFQKPFLFRGSLSQTSVR